MQKVVGSSPISRFDRNPPEIRGFLSGEVESTDPWASDIGIKWRARFESVDPHLEAFREHKRVFRRFRWLKTNSPAQA